jgi:hypothetical protein
LRNSLAVERKQFLVGPPDFPFWGNNSNQLQQRCQPEELIFPHRSNGDQEGVVWSVWMQSRRVVDGVADTALIRGAARLPTFFNKPASNRQVNGDRLKAAQDGCQRRSGITMYPPAHHVRSEASPSGSADQSLEMEWKARPAPKLPMTTSAGVISHMTTIAGPSNIAHISPHGLRVWPSRHLPFLVLYISHVLLVFHYTDSPNDVHLYLLRLIIECRRLGFVPCYRMLSGMQPQPLFGFGRGDPR